MNRFSAAILICLSMATNACTNEPEARPTTLAKEQATSDQASSVSDSDAIELATGPIVERVRKQYSGRIAGLFFEREQHRIVVRLTGSEKIPSEVHKVGNQKLDVVFVPNAAHSFSELNHIMSTKADMIQARLPTAHARYVDERTGEIVITVDKDAEMSTKTRNALSSALGAPVRIVAQDSEVAQ